MARQIRACRTAYRTSAHTSWRSLPGSSHPPGATSSLTSMRSSGMLGACSRSNTTVLITIRLPGGTAQPSNPPRMNYSSALATCRSGCGWVTCNRLIRHALFSSSPRKQGPLKLPARWCRPFRTAIQVRSRALPRTWTEVRNSAQLNRPRPWLLPGGAGTPAASGPLLAPGPAGHRSAAGSAAPVSGVSGASASSAECGSNPRPTADRARG